MSTQTSILQELTFKYHFLNANSVRFTAIDKIMVNTNKIHIYIKEKLRYAN